jgi:Lon protease-like protein
MSQHTRPPGDFGGTARLFPLPNLVLFPHVAQPLHVFEPRYRQMMADALAGDRLLGMALLRPGWEEEYQKKPPVHPIICVGRIVQEEQLPDGKYNLILHGLSRARIVEEVASPKLYRIAKVDLCQDVPPAGAREAPLRQALGQGVRPFFAGNAQALGQLERLLDGPLALGPLCDVFSYALPLDVEVKQRLLETLDVEARVGRLLEALRGQKPPAAGETPRRPFPPEFSTN